MTQSLGVVDIEWNGVKIPVEKGATCKLGGLTNKPVVAGRQVFRSQEMLPTEVKATTPLLSGQKIGDITAISEGVLQFICDTGQTYVCSDAFINAQIEITGGEGGKLTLMWAGNEAEEVLT